MAPQQVRKIIVQVDAGNTKSEMKSISNSLKSMSMDVSSVAGNFNLVKSALTGFISTQVISSFVAMADSMQLLNDRLRGLLGSQDEATYAMAKLQSVAKSTNAPIDELAGTFARIAVATKSVGLSTQSMLDLTQLLQNSFRLSGASTEEAASSTIQFSQALSFGALRGQELRSVLSQNAVLANIFRESIKNTGDDIFKFAEKGGFTTKFVLKALAQNMDDINIKAKDLGQTFSQTITKAMNELKIKAGEINQEFSLNAKFAKFMQWIIDNASTISAGFFSIAAGITAMKIAAAAATIELGAIAASLGSIPVLIGLGVTALTLIIIKFDEFTKLIKTVTADFIIFNAKLTMFFVDMTAKVKSFFGGNTAYFKSVSAGIQTYIDDLERYKETLDTTKKSAYDAATNSSGMGDLRQMDRVVSGLKDQVDKLKDTPKKITIDEKISNLNKAFNEGTISVAKYNSEILKLTEEKFTTAGPARLKKELDKIKIESLTREFEQGDLTIQEYQRSLNTFKLEKLQKDFEAAKISAAEYHKKLVEISKEYSSNSALVIGTDNYIKKVGNTTTMVAGLIEGTFDKLGDSLSSWIETGKFKFADFTSAVLSDLNKIIVRAMIIRPLAEGILNWAGAGEIGGGMASGMTGGSFGSANTMSPAMFASGGVVSGATAFLNNGKPSIMGEAGPEAILPLSRTANGDLGISAKMNPVTVNIINNSGAEITQKESSGPNGKTLDIVINSKVKEAIASGALDKSFQQAYGLKRRGN